MGTAKLRTTDEMVARRRRLAGYYRDRLQRVALLQTMPRDATTSPNWQSYQSAARGRCPLGQL